MDLQLLENFDTSLLFLYLGAAALLLTAALVLWWRLLHRGDRSIGRAARKARDITAEAAKKASSLLVEAELEGIEAVSRHKISAQRLEEVYETELNKLSLEMKGHLETHAAELKSQFSQVVEDSRKQIGQVTADLRDFVEGAKQLSNRHLSNREDELLETFDQNLSQLFEATKERLTRTVDDGLAEVSQAVSSYKSRRLKVLDDQILRLLERTLEITLGRKLSLGDHADIVLKSLEEAKKEGFFENDGS